MLAEKLLPVVKAVPTDPYFYDVTMLLTGNGTNGAQNNTFLDSSSNAFSITRAGNTTQGSFSPYGTLWSNYFDGSSYLSLANNAAFNMGTGDFTVEAWIYLPSVAVYNGVVSLGKYLNGGGILRVTDSAKLQWYFNDASLLITSTASVSANTWTHVAAVRSSGTTKLYINGVNSGSSADTSNYTSTYATLIGGDNQASPANLLTGYISNARVVKGTAVYTNNFTPSTTPLTAISGTSLLTCQSNRFIDNSSNAFSITAVTSPKVQRFSPFNPTSAYSTATIGGSGYFDGTGDSLTLASNAAFGFGTGNFTAELWFYPLSTAAAVLYDPRTANDQNPSIQWGTTVTSKFQVTTNQIVITSTSTYSIGQWYHVAVTRSGTTVTLWVNGVSQGTATISTNLPSTSVIIGDYISGGGYSANGYISDFRINKGTAIYTGAFTPPSLAPLATSGASSAACYPSTTNVNTSFAASTTSLLTSMTNAGIPDSAMMNDLETVGNAQVSTSVKKYGTGSVYFDGSGDSLYSPPSPNNVLNGNFTIEYWINPVNNTGVSGYSMHVASASSGNATYFGVKSATSYVAQLSGGGEWLVTGVPSTGTWTHLAWVRSGTTLTLYINGTSAGTTTTSATAFSATYGLNVGQAFGGSEFFLNGYIDDLRITKGYARYTTNFTPPTAALPTY